MNLCFDALDLRVIRGDAGAPALVDGATRTDVARLLEETAALAGAMRGLGVVPGARVAVEPSAPRTRLVAALAALRLGAVPVLDAGAGAGAGGGAGDVALLVADVAPGADHPAPAVLLDGGEPVVETRDLSLAVAVRAGRTDPAPLADPLPGEPSYVVGEREVHDPEAESFLGNALAALVAGRPIQL